MNSMMAAFAHPSGPFIYGLAAVAGLLLAVSILMINLGSEETATAAFLPLLFGVTALFIAAVLFLLRALNRAIERSPSGN